MKLGLGTVQFGMQYGVANTSERVSLESARSILDRAREVGVEFLDTAIAYGNSESVLGQLGSGGWNIVTKLPPVPDSCLNVGNWVENQVRDSLNRLCTQDVYGLLLHRSGQLRGSNGRKIFHAMQELKNKGLVKKVGVSIYNTQELEDLPNLCEIDLVQAPLNVIDRSLVETGWAERLKSTGVEIHARSVFLQGLLLLPSCSRPSKFDRWGNIWKEWDRWLKASQLSPLQACLRYAASIQQVDVVVVGVDSLTQFDAILRSIYGQLDSLPAFEALEDARLINPSTWGQL